jgi:hypothetical protein
MNEQKIDDPPNLKKDRCYTKFGGIEYRQNKTENHFSHYPRSQVDINSYTRLKIAMSLIAGKA